MKELKTAEFEKDVLQAQGKVLVDFWAPWCMPCKMLSPVVEEISKERQDVRFYKMNVDEEQPLAAKYEVASIPTLLLFENGKVLRQSVGFLPKEDILAWLDGR